MRTTALGVAAGGEACAQAFSGDRGTRGREDRAVYRPAGAPRARFQRPAGARQARSHSRAQVVLEHIRGKPRGGKGASGKGARAPGGASAPPTAWPDVVQTQGAAVRCLSPCLRVCLWPAPVDSAPSIRRHETGTAAVGTGIAGRVPGGVDRLRDRVSRALPLRAASLPGVDSYRFLPDAVRLCAMGGPGPPIAFRPSRGARWSCRGAVLYGPRVGPATAAPIQDRSRPEDSRRRGGRLRGSAPKAKSPDSVTMTPLRRPYDAIVWWERRRIPFNAILLVPAPAFWSRPLVRLGIRLIGSRPSWRGHPLKRNELGLLSNFAPTPFTFRGQRYASLEGFWQMMLYPEGPRSRLEAHAGGSRADDELRGQGRRHAGRREHEEDGNRLGHFRRQTD